MDNILSAQFRGGLKECAHYGYICAVNENGVLFSLGNENEMCYMRSASKPIQVLPFLLQGIDKTYGLNEQEIALMSASHHGQFEHIEIINSLIEKTNINEEDLVMPLSYPQDSLAHNHMIKNDIPPRKIYHNCIGKHVALMLFMRHNGCLEKDYWKINSLVQQNIISFISKFSEYDKDMINIGIDGCGVPVFGMPIKNIAKAYLKLGCPDLIDDSILANTVSFNTSIMNRNGQTISGLNALDHILLSDSNIVSKIGAWGLSCVSLKKERMAFVVKNLSGLMEPLPIIVASVLKQINYSNKETIHNLEKHSESVLKNDLGFEVATHRAIFKI